LGVPAADRSHRLVAEIQWHAGEMLPEVRFVVTNLADPPKNVDRLRTGGGACEHWLKCRRGCPPGKHAVESMRLSCHQSKESEVWLALFVPAYNLDNFRRRLFLPPEMASWCLPALREKLAKIWHRLTRHTRRPVLQMADVNIPRGLFEQILSGVRCLTPLPT